MLTLPAIFILLINLSGCASLRGLQSSPPACDYALQVCGGLSIPYPFGMSDDCGLQNYRILCKHNASFGDGNLPFLQIGTSNTSELQVLSISTNTLIVNSTHLKAMSTLQNCASHGEAALELSRGGPFILSEDNWFVVVGCNADGTCTADTRADNQSSTISCTNSCYNQYVMPFCNDYTCCINPIPPRSWRLEFQGSGAGYKDFPGVCGFSTVLSPSTYKVPPDQKGFFAAGHYGLSISWALQLHDDDQNCRTAKQRSDYACTETAECIFDGTLHGYTCNCTQGYRGDGYKAGIGCEDINECEEQLDECENPPLGMCTNTVGSYRCSCTAGEGSGLPGTCPSINQSANVLLPALVGGLVGALILAVLFAFICISRRAYRKRRERQENFQRIGGDQLKSFLFSERELVKATNGFSSNHVIGEGGFGKVYWGKVSTEHGTIKVAIKRAKPKAVEEQIAQMQSFVKEIVLLSSTSHKNVVRLLGCCVETSVPLLVYEYVEKGTLREYLKPQGRDSNLILRGGKAGSGCNSLWAWRLHVAVETAEALAHLHNLPEPIFHLDMKSANILIDKQYNPKVADFGLSCFLASDATHLTNPLVAGTFGYVDPEYYYSLRITDKCDVYSFGVILLELISSRPANGPGAVLAHHFRTDVNMKEEIEKHGRQLPSFIDGRLEYDADVCASINGVAEVARGCVALKGSERPSMREVVRQLKRVQSKSSGKMKFKRGTGGNRASNGGFFSDDCEPELGVPLVNGQESASTSSVEDSSYEISASRSSTIELQHLDR